MTDTKFIVTEVDIEAARAQIAADEKAQLAEREKLKLRQSVCRHKEMGLLCFEPNYNVPDDHDPDRYWLECTDCAFRTDIDCSLYYALYELKEADND